MTKENTPASNLAPIVLFAYNRPDHTKQTIEALQKNELASESELFIYSDEAKNDDVRNSVDEVREYIDGVTSIVNEYGKIIVLEDDLVTSPYFLKFMNDGLEFYENEEKVWHISGWNYPIETDGLDDVFLYRLMNCWGWATWANRWQHFEKDIDKTMSEFTKSDIDRFNLDGAENFWGQVVSNKEKKINTWAIFWYAIIFKQNGLCLNPTQTLVENVGHDGSGVHCGENESYKSNLSTNKHISFECDTIENRVALDRIQHFYQSQKKSFTTRVINKLARITIGKNIIK